MPEQKPELPTVVKIQTAINQMGWLERDYPSSAMIPMLQRHRRVLEWAEKWNWQALCEETQVPAPVMYHALREYQSIAILCGETTDGHTFDVGIKWAKADAAALEEREKA